MFSIINISLNLNIKHLFNYLNKSGNTNNQISPKILIEDIEKKKEIFVEHDAYKKSLDILKKNKKIIVSGIPGVGKTTLCEQSALYIHNELKKFNVYLFNSLDDFLIYYDFSQKKHIYIIDDIFGQISWNNNIEESDLKKLFSYKHKRKYL